MRGGATQAAAEEGKNNKLAAAREAARKAVTQVQRNERERQHGKTKYNLSRRLGELRNAESATGEATGENNERIVDKRQRATERERRLMTEEEYRGKMKPPETKRGLNVTSANIQASQTYQSLKDEPVKAVEAQRAEIEKMINKYTAMKKDELGPRKSAIYPDIRHLYKNLNEKVGNILNDLGSVDTNRFTVLHSINEKKTLTKLKSYLRDDKQKADGDFAELFEKIKREEEEITEMKENLDSKVSEAREKIEDRENRLQVNQDDELQPEEGNSASTNLQSPAPNPGEANGNFQTSKTNFLQKMYDVKTSLTSKKNANLEKKKDYEKKNAPEANELKGKIHAKIVEIDKWYDEKINLIGEIIKETTKLLESDAAGVIMQQENYERYEFTEPQFLIQALSELENRYSENLPPGVNSSTEGDRGNSFGTQSADSAAAPSETEAAEITRLTQQLTDIKAQEEAVKQTVDNQALEIHELKEQAKEAKETAQTAQTATKDLETQAAQAAQEVEASKTEIKEALETMLTSLKKRLEQEKDNVSEEVNKTIKDKILQVEGFIKKPDLDINVLTNVERINNEIETAKYKHEFSAEGVKEICERLQELMAQLTRHSRPTLTGGRKTRNNKKKKKSKAKKNKTRRRRRRRSKA